MMHGGAGHSRSGTVQPTGGRAHSTAGTDTSAIALSARSWDSSRRGGGIITRRIRRSLQRLRIQTIGVNAQGPRNAVHHYRKSSKKKKIMTKMTWQKKTKSLPCDWATLRWYSASLNSGVLEMLTAALFVAEVRVLLVRASILTAGALLLERELRGVVEPVPLHATPAPPPPVLIPAETRAVLSSVLEFELAPTGPTILGGRLSGSGALLLDRELRGVELRLRPLVATPIASVGVAVPVAVPDSARVGFVRDATGVERLSAEASAFAAMAALLPLSM